MSRFVRLPASLGLTLLIAAPAAAAGASETTASLQSYARARQVLDRALQAAGGASALQAVKNISRKGIGTAYNIGQSLEPAGRASSRAVELRTVADLADKRSFTETGTTPSGGLPTKTRAIVKGDAGFGHNLLTNVVTPLAPPGVTAARAALRRDPAVLLLSAAERADTLRHVGDAVVDGARQDVITFADAEGAQISLFVDAATGRLSRYETLVDHAVLGDTTTDVSFSDYRPVSGVQVPFRVVTRLGGEVTQDVRYSDIQINGQPEAALFEAPAAAPRASAARGAATVEATPIGDGAFFLAGSTHNSLLVVFKDHSVLVEAPLGEERTAALAAKIAEIAPGKPVRYVVPTHYHFDHSGGLRGWIAQGATIVTTPGNKAFIEQLAAAPHTIRPDALARQPRKPAIETFTAKRVFGDGARSLEIHDVGPNPHAKEIAIAYLPQEKLVFVVDLFGIPAEGPLAPAGPATAQFADRLKALGLSVEKIASGHGRIGTFDELRQALSAGAAAAPPAGGMD